MVCISKLTQLHTADDSTDFHLLILLLKTHRDCRRNRMYKYLRIQGREDSYITKYPKGIFRQ